MSIPTGHHLTQSAAIDERTYVAPTSTERWQSLLDVVLLYGLSAYYLFKTTLIWLLTKPTAVLFRFSDLRSKAFVDFWITTQGDDPRTGPLRDYVPLVGTAKGVVLDLGPGDGRQVKWFTNPSIKAIYGAEPCIPFHDELQKSVEKAGLEDKYHVMTCGGERQSLRPKLKELGLLKADEKGGVFDTIVCLKVLCGIPNPKDTVESLYGLLKPGGKLIVLEHVKNPWRSRKGSLRARLVQKIFMLIGWKFIMGGCVLDRDTFEILKKVADRDGGWYVVDVGRVVEWGPISWILGEFVKQP